VVSTPLKNMKVSWDYFSQYDGEYKSHVPNHQPVIQYHVHHLPIERLMQVTPL